MLIQPEARTARSVVGKVVVGVGFVYSSEVEGLKRSLLERSTSESRLASRPEAILDLIRLKVILVPGSCRLTAAGSAGHHAVGTSS